MADAVTLTRYDITDLNNGAIPDFPVDDPPGWDEISLYYAKALQEMGWNESGEGDAPSAPENPENDPVPGTPNVENTWNFSEEPESYFFWGAMHWWPGHEWEYWNTTAPSPQDQYWSHCTHGSAHVGKYFLPWHRAYIYFYEVIVRAKVAELGGPSNWALPYWDYSHHDPSNPSTPWPRARLPWVFCQPTLPDGSGNPLHLDWPRRGLQPTWPDGQAMFLQPGTPYYAAAYGQSSWGSTVSNRGFNSVLDGRPHGAVHVDTGNGDGLVSATGWMQNTQTAGFDPIFWLHHSEIDRFWVGWNAAGGQNPNQQTDPAWLTAADDEVGGEPVVGRWNFWMDGDIGNVIVVHPGEMVDPASLDSGKFPYSYEYQDLPTVPAPRQGGRAIVADAVPGLAVPAAPAAAVPMSARREIASHDEGLEVGHEPVTMQVTLAGEALRALDEGAEEEGGERVFLELDGIVTKNPPGNYEIYLNKPEVDRDTAGEVPNFVGMFSAFGAGHRHGGEGEERHGASARYDITDLVAYLRARGEWDESAVRITFVPAVPRIGDMTPVTAPVTIGSVRVVTE